MANTVYFYKGYNMNMLDKISKEVEQRLANADGSIWNKSISLELKNGKTLFVQRTWNEKEGHTYRLYDDDTSLIAELDYALCHEALDYEVAIMIIECNRRQ